MKTNLTPETITRYQRDGFVKIDSFLSAQELETWRTRITAAVTDRNERIPGANDGGGVGDDFYDNVFTQRVNLWRTDNQLKQLVLKEDIGKMAARLEGVDGVRIWHDQALFKGPWANPTAWHLDDPYWSFYSRHATTIWVALDDVTAQNGALYFLPGSHKQARLDNVDLGPNVGDLFKVYPEWKTHEPVCLEMKAGDASFHNGIMPHAAGPNMTPHPRRAFAMIFMPDGSVFNGIRNVMPSKQFESLKKGDVLNDDEFNPLIYPVPQSRSVE